MNIDKIQVREASIEELEAWWDKKIDAQPENIAYKEWKNNFVEGNKQGNRKTFFAFDENNSYIGQGTLSIVSEDDDLTNNGKAEIIKFEVNRDMRGNGICSKIYKKIVEYAKSIGIKTLTIGVEPRETRNIQIYFHWGFLDFIKLTSETYPPRGPGLEPETVYVLYYKKEI